MKNEWKNKWIAAGIAAVAMAVVISGVFLFLRSGRQMSVKMTPITFRMERWSPVKGAGDDLR